ncbi:MAG: cytochrome bc complex cytochrome b subunit [Gemmatimonadota bacterium]|jgi:cytochrome b6|nr:cytochrome bc complex cytochrome b subunit [Gemmatimonadota bacterium]
MSGGEPSRGNGKPSRLYGWIDERFQIGKLVEFAAHKTVPVHHESLWYYFGGVTLFLFMIQVATGILLMLYYKPGAETAFESVRFILSEVEFGWLVRAIHSWSANLMILAAFIHMFSVFFTRAYQKPRELTWVTGMVLLLLGLGFGFSGYLLPWNELAFFATKVGTDIMGVLPVVGTAMLSLLRGGEDVTGATLFRFYGIHVAVLPGLMVMMLFVHLMCVQRQGMSAPQSWESKPPRERKSISFFPSFLLRDALLWLIVLNVLAVLAVVAPFGIGPFEWPLGEKADPFLPAPEGIRPEWYFMFMFQTLKLLPAHVGPIEGELLGVLAFGLAGLLWILIPFLDRSKPGSVGARVVQGIGWCVVIFIVVMTVWGYLA